MTEENRLILMNQYLILDSLYPGQGYKGDAETMKNGFQLEMERLVNSSVDSFIPEDVQNLVYDIVDIYLHMQDLKERYEKAGNTSTIDVTFPGFDHKENEGKELRFFHHLLKTSAAIKPIQTKPNGESHCKVVNRYQKQLIEFYKHKPFDYENIQAVMDIL